MYTNNISNISVAIVFPATDIRGAHDYQTGQLIPVTTVKKVTPLQYIVLGSAWRYSGTEMREV
jgi:hypothetical protein